MQISFLNHHNNHYVLLWQNLCSMVKSEISRYLVCVIYRYIWQQYIARAPAPANKIQTNRDHLKCTVYSLLRVYKIGVWQFTTLFCLVYLPYFLSPKTHKIQFFLFSADKVKASYIYVYCICKIYVLYASSLIYIIRISSTYCG